jgi:hypothetical protein
MYKTWPVRASAVSAAALLFAIALGASPLAGHVTGGTPHQAAIAVVSTSAADQAGTGGGSGPPWT